MSPTGLERCETCHEGFYQSEYAQVKCLPCPDGSTTLRRGARGKQHCKGRTFPRISLVSIAQRICNGAEWSKDKTQAAESIKWRPQQAYGSNQFLLVQPQTVFSTHTKSSRSRIDKRTARATGNTRYRYNKIAPLDHKMADNCVSLARTNTLSSTITKLIKTSKTSNKRYSYHLLNRINKMYTHDLFYLQQEWEAWLAPVYIQIRTTKSQLTQCTKYNCH